MHAVERHIGRNISRVRELLGVKQETLAFSLGLSQQSVSIIEKNAKVDEEKLRSVAEALNVNPEIIRNFDEAKILEYLEKSVEPTATAATIDHNILFRYLFELFEANNRLHAEKQSLYERLLETEQEKYSHLEKIFHLNHIK
ncbi:helix-turn-helix domain-containing protein [Flavobacterium selenitireducens]|uniref:helix-turn-helix domain-containing protein n=1 Tax=Flavobacterium selenitireducens TaxID=2722704 RepID=UPI00168A6DCB|nr:helix-turn-helix transcriptional regulator [Flavobacterium selenitireducens]